MSRMMKRTAAMIAAISVVSSSAVTAYAKEDEPLTLGSLTSVETDIAPTSAAEGGYRAAEACYEGALVQESIWNSKLLLLLSMLAGESFTVDPGAFIEETWYATLLANAEIHADAATDAVVVNAAVSYPYGQRLADAVNLMLAETGETVTCDTVLEGTFQLNVDASHLADSTEMPLTASMKINGWTSPQEILDGMQGIIDGIRTQLEEKGLTDACAVLEVEQARLSTMSEKLASQSQISYTAQDANKLLADAKNYTGCDLYAVFYGILEQIADKTQENGYYLKMSAEELDTMLAQLSGITVDVSYADCLADGVVWGYMTDEITDYTVYASYFNTELAVEGL